jgi:hypothetical protein
LINANQTIFLMQLVSIYIFYYNRVARIKQTALLLIIEHVWRHD